jgi:putative phosphoribosyl transferase
MERFIDREYAGAMLADKLKTYASRKDALVLGLPRGGVPVAFEVAKALNLTLDVFLVRKLGVPGHEELAMGAIAIGGCRVFNEDIVKTFSLSQKSINKVIKAEEEVLLRRDEHYRGDRPFPVLSHKIILLVDDGIATGATMRVAIKALREHNPAKIIVAVPVGSAATCEALDSVADEVICLLKPMQFHAVGLWYENFSQTTDEEVRVLLAKSLE